MTKKCLSNWSSDLNMTSILKHEIVVENYFDFQCSHMLLPSPKQASVCSLPHCIHEQSLSPDKEVCAFCNQGLSMSPIHI